MGDDEPRRYRKYLERESGEEDIPLRTAMRKVPRFSSTADESGSSYESAPLSLSEATPSHENAPEPMEVADPSAEDDVYYDADYFTELDFVNEFGDVHDVSSDSQTSANIEAPHDDGEGAHSFEQAATEQDAPTSKQTPSSSSERTHTEKSPDTDDLASLKLDDKPNSSCPFTKFEILMMILHFAVRFSLSNVAIIALLKLVNTVLQAKILPPTNHFFKKVFRSDLPIQVHFYCPSCLLYLGLRDDCKVKNCPMCKKPVLSDKSNNGHFFLTIPLADQIRMKLEQEGEDITNFRRKRKTNCDVIADIFDGVLFSELEEKAKLRKNDITITGSTDGSPVFNSGRRSLWPIQFFINEIDLKKRFSAINSFVYGLWFGKGKVNMTTYLTPFIKELQSLAAKGVTWFNKVTNSVKTSRVFLLHFVTDTIAKAPVMNMIQFNGHHGCYLCYHFGTAVPEVNNHIRYPIQDATERTDESLREDMNNALETRQKVNGVFGPSPLIYAPYFNITYGVSLDFMHAFLLGVTKYLFCDIWCGAKFKGEPFYLKDKLSTIDEILLNFKPPSNVSRDPRSILYASDFKANEWRNWVLYYAPVCLKEVLPRKCYEHFCLLSSSLYKLLQHEINRSELPAIGESLDLFCSQFEEFYGLSSMTYNLHLLRHAKKAVIMCGPLWGSSMFSFESVNGFLVNLVSGPTGVPLQICRKYCTIVSIPTFLSKHPPLSEEVSDYCQITLSSRRMLKKACSFGRVTVLGDEVKYPFVPSVEDSVVFAEAGINVDSLFLVEKIIFEGEKFTRVPLGTRKKNNSFIKLKDGTFARIEELCISTERHDEVFALVKVLPLSNVSSPCSATHLKFCDQHLFSHMNKLVPVSTTFDAKCILLQCKDERYVTVCFYNFEKD